MMTAMIAGFDGDEDKLAAVIHGLISWTTIPLRAARGAALFRSLSSAERP
jgi:hypothetical protein